MSDDETHPLLRFLRHHEDAENIARIYIHHAEIDGEPTSWLWHNCDDAEIVALLRDLADTFEAKAGRGYDA